VCPNIYDLGVFSAKPNQFFKKIINIGSLGSGVVNEKDISFQKKPEALMPKVFESLLCIQQTYLNASCFPLKPYGNFTLVHNNGDFTNTI